MGREGLFMKQRSESYSVAHIRLTLSLLAGAFGSQTNGVRRMGREELFMKPRSESYSVAYIRLTLSS